jgi:hypothetical protein
MAPEFRQDNLSMKAEGHVTHGPGTTIITIVIPKGWTPEQDGEPIDVDDFARYLRYMTEQWMVEVVRIPDGVTE